MGLKLHSSGDALQWRQGLFQASGIRKNKQGKLQQLLSTERPQHNIPTQPFIETERAHCPSVRARTEAVVLGQSGPRGVPRNDIHISGSMLWWGQWADISNGRCASQVATAQAQGSQLAHGPQASGIVEEAATCGLYRALCSGRCICSLRVSGAQLAE